MSLKDGSMQTQSSRLSPTCIIISVIACTFAGGRSGFAETKVRTVSVPDNGQAVAARTDAEGNIHLVFNSDSGPRYASSADNGQSFGDSIPILDSAAQESGLSFSAWDMAIGSGGRIHVAMSTNAWELKRPKEEWALYYARLDPEADSFTAVRNINRTPSEGFSLAADDKGNASACWLSGKLYANVSHDNGKTFTSSVEIDPEINPCDCCTTSCAYGAGGELVVLYREETNNERDMFLLFWNQDSNQRSRTPVSRTLWKVNGCPMTYFTVTRTSAGFATVWPTKGHVYFARLDPKGAMLPPGEVRTHGKTGMRIGMLSLDDAEGNTLIVWKELGHLSWQLYDQQGSPLKTSGSVESSGSGVAGVVDKKGEFVLFY
jgi:hypothetical protein